MYIDPMLVDCWAILADYVLTLGHPEVNIYCMWDRLPRTATSTKLHTKSSIQLTRRGLRLHIYGGSYPPIFVPEKPYINKAL